MVRSIRFFDPIRRRGPRRRAAACGLALAVLVTGAPGAEEPTAPGDVSNRSAEGPAPTGPEAGADPAGAPERSEPARPPVPHFDPSEHVPAGSSVSFPVDI